MTWRTHAFRHGAAMLLLLAACGLAMILTTPPSPLAASDRFFEGLVFRLLAPPASDEIVIIGITDETLAQLPYRAPIDRGFLADLLDKISAMNPRVIGLDIVFDRPTEEDKDEVLQETIDNLPQPVVVAAIGTATPLTDEQRRFHDAFIGQRRHGLANLPRSRLDSTVRSYLPIINGEKSFAAAIVEAIGQTPPDFPFRIHWRQLHEDRFFRMYPAHLAELFNPDWITGKIVLIGTFVGSQDEHQTPISALSRPLYGIEIHAHAVEQMINGRVTPEASSVSGVIMVVGAALAGIALALIPTSPIFVSGLVMGVALIWFGSAVAFFFTEVPLLPLGPTLSFGMAATGIRYYRLRQERRERRLLGTLFSKFVSPQVLDELMRERETFLANNRPVPQRLVATVFFSDIAGFTPICESLDPDSLMLWLDRYIDTMVNIVHQNGGVVLRFMGDGILAVFGAPVARTDESEIDADARNAVRCAIGMVSAMHTLNEEYATRQLPCAAIRIGIHTGQMLAGSLGTGIHMEYCVQGDVVNTAARLEALGKNYTINKDDSVILIGGPTFERLNGEFDARPVGEVKLRGKANAVTIYRVIA